MPPLIFPGILAARGSSPVLKRDSLGTAETVPRYKALPTLCCTDFRERNMWDTRKIACSRRVSEPHQRRKAICCCVPGTDDGW
jgi:hypothetical protein